MSNEKRALVDAIMKYENLVKYDAPIAEQNAAWALIEPLRQAYWEASEEWQEINAETHDQNT